MPPMVYIRKFIPQGGVYASHGGYTRVYLRVYASHDGYTRVYLRVVASLGGIYQGVPQEGSLPWVVYTRVYLRVCSLPGCVCTIGCTSGCVASLGRCTIGCTSGCVVSLGV